MRLLTLMYHSITRDGANNPYSIDERRFEEQLRWLRQTGHQSVSIAQVADWLDGYASLPSRAVLITFDDGYLDNLEVALPLLQRYLFSACIFVSTNWIGEKERHYSQLGEKMLPMLTWEELRQLANAGIDIGSHTLSHPFLTELPAERAWEEIHQAKQELERHLGRETLAFSYPNSRHNANLREMVKRAGYRLAFSGYPGGDMLYRDHYNLYRLCIYNNRSKAEFVFNTIIGMDLRGLYWNWCRRLMKLPAEQTRQTTPSYQGEEAGAL